MHDPDTEQDDEVDETPGVDEWIAVESEAEALETPPEE